MSGFEFEGDEVVDFLGVLPKAVLECPEAYVRGTQLNLNVEVRVKSVRLEEDRKGNLLRQHVFAIEAVSIKDKIDPQAVLQQSVVTPEVPEEEHAEIGPCWCGPDQHIPNADLDEPIEFIVNDELVNVDAQ